MTTDWSRRGPAAEKTVDILKARVRSLYNDGAQTAIHRQLERAREREEKQRRKREVMLARTDELERYSKELEQTVADRTADLRAILDNVTFGFVVVDSEARIQPGFTASCEALLSRTITEGDDLCEVLGAVGTSAESMMRIGIEQVFDDFMPEEVSVQQIPQHFTAGSRRLRAECRAVRDASGAVATLLVTISDVTALHEAERRSQQNAALVGILRQRSAFAGFVADTRSRLDACRERIDEQDLVRRAVHTIKGNASSYGLLDVAGYAHRIEGHATISPEDLKGLGNELTDWVMAHVDVLGEDIMVGSAAIELGRQDVQKLRELLDAVDESELLAWGRDLLRRPMSELIGPMAVFVERICERIERPVRFELEGESLRVDPEVMQPVVTTLTHLVRNAIDHGIEPEAERGDKDPMGTLTARFGESNARWFIEIADDGRGLDLERIKAKAVEAGHIDAGAADAMTPGELSALIFLDGLSSRDEATELSGRGVGMSAVKEVVESLGGEIIVTTSTGAGTTVRLEVPSQPPTVAA